MMAAMLSLTQIAVLSMPVAADTAAFAVPSDHALRVFVNQPGAHQTAQLELELAETASQSTLEALAPLPLMAADAVACGGAYLLTGSDPHTGKALVLAVATSGAVTWRVELTGPQPTRWPVPLCAKQPYVAWQTEPGHLEVARVDERGLHDQRRVSVGGPSLELAAVGGTIWAAWADATGVHALDVLAPRASVLGVAIGRADSVALVAEPGGVRALWVRARTAYTSLVQSSSPAQPQLIALAAHGGGKVSVLAGPLAFSQALASAETDGSAVWSAELRAPGSAQPLPLPAPVRAIIRWKNRLFVVGSHELRIYDVHP